MTASGGLPEPFAPLAAVRQFITYRLEPDPHRPGKTIKRPLHWQTGRTYSPTDPACWTDYATAAAHAPADGGVGFVFTDEDPWWFLDVDNAWDGAAWSPVAQWLFGALPGAALEVSQSGTGLHFIGRGTVPPHACRNVLAGLELYTGKRFVALTGRQASGHADTDHSAALAAIVGHYFPPSAAGDIAGWSDAPVPEWDGPRTDAALLKAARASGKRSAAGAFGGGVTFEDLWTANATALAAKWPGKTDGYDASSADGALATHLAYWTGRDHERTKTLMLQSALKREKWEMRADYLDTTILKGASAASGVATGHTKPTVTASPAALTAAAEGAAGLSNGWTGVMDKQDHLCLEAFIAGIGAVPRYDEFADAVILPDGTRSTDALENEIYLKVRSASNLFFAQDLFGRTWMNMAWQRRFHPVRDYFDAREAQWDGQPRIDTWLRDYCGAEDTPFNRAVSSIFLRAAVRRVRQPGHKYDELLVLDGPQGLGKSSAFAALCPQREWFTDEVTVGMTSKELLEVAAGKLVVEMPELSKLKTAEIEHVKAMLSRQFDRARMAFGKRAVEMGRQWVGGATTNKRNFLTDPTGNRRFYLTTVTRIDLHGLGTACDQLWAEAAVMDRLNPSVMLPQVLWADARALQESRMQDDPIYERLSDLLGDMTGRILSSEIWKALGVPITQQPALTHKRGDALMRLGWSYSRLRVPGGAGERAGYYVRGPEEQHVREIVYDVTGANAAMRFGTPLTVVK